METNRIRKIKFIYNYESLNKYCNKNQIKLTKDYSKEKLIRESIIEYHCSCIECKQVYSNNLRQSFKNNFKCKLCITKQQKEKTKNTCIEKYGQSHISLIDKFKEKRKETCIQKYGCEFGFQNETIKEKIKKTNLEKYGVDNPSQNNEIKEKIKKTNLEKYGVEIGFQSNEIKEKIKKTNLEKYGVENIFQNKDIINNIKKECLEKYGVEHMMQLPHIAEKSSKLSYSMKKYKFPSNKIINIQGYENFALDKLLLDKINESDIITSKSEVPNIWYEVNDKKHRHFVDIFIKNQNKCIEVKSIWTFEKKKDNVLLKQTKAKELGYLYEIWIFNPNGKLIKVIN